MKKELYHLTQPLAELLESDKEKLYTMCYKLLVLNTLCHRNDDEWRQRFLEKKGFECLWRMLFCFRSQRPCDDWRQVDELGPAMLIKVLYFMCESIKAFDIPRHIFRNSIILMLTNSVRITNVKFDDVKDSYVGIERLARMEKNTIAHHICMCQIGVDCVVGIVPRDMMQMYSSPLISGYIKQCNLQRDVPMDIYTLVMHFFF